MNGVSGLVAAEKQGSRRCACAPPPPSGGLPSLRGCLAPQGPNRQGAHLAFAGSWSCSLDPKHSPPSQGTAFCRGNPCCSTSFFQNASPFPSPWIVGLARAPRGGAEWNGLKFSKEGEPQLVLTLRKGDSLLG